MLGKPKYKMDDRVVFITGKNMTLEGNIYIIDAWGTFDQDKEVSYDIMVGSGDDRCLYKHVVETEVVKKVE